MAKTTDNTNVNGISPNTRVAISQKNRIYHVGARPGAAATSNTQIGVLSTFRYDESRSIDAVRGVGYGDRIAELVPGVTEPMGLSFTRTMLYTQGVIQALGYKGGIDGIVRSLRHHKWPFDIQSELLASELATGAATTGGTAITTTGNDHDGAFIIITKFWNCWLENYSVDFPSDSAIVIEEASGKATDVTDGTAVSSYFQKLDTGNGI